MNKCGFCAHSYNAEGVLKCPYNVCKLTQSDILDTLQELTIFVKSTRA